MKPIRWANSLSPAALILLAVLWRILLVIVFSSTVAERTPDRVILPDFGFIANDYHYFIDPAENYYQTGRYALSEDEPFAGRMPGYAVFYLAFRFLMSPAAANAMMIIVQALLGGFGAYALARAAHWFYRRETAFFIVYAVGFLYPVTAFFDYQTLTEGLAVNNLCLALYFSLRSLRESRPRWMLLAGVFLTWAVFLRPFLGILLPLYGLFVIWQGGGSWPRRIGRAVILGVPFTLALLAWNIRNYQVMDRVVLLEAPNYVSYGKTYSPAWIAVRNLINDWGGDPAYFQPGSDGEWFRIDRKDTVLELDPEIYATGCFAPEELYVLKQDFQRFHYSPGFDSTLNEAIVERVREYRSCYLAQQTVLDRSENTVEKIARSIFRSGSSYMPLVAPTVLDKALRLLYLGMYYLLMLAWLLAAVLQRRGWVWLLPAIAVVAGILQFSSVFENRYFLTVFPFVIVGATGFVLWLMERTGRIQRMEHRP